MMNIYQEELTNHYRNPRNRGELETPDFVSGRFNPSCGDSVAMQGIVTGDAVTRLQFTGQGCVISQAAASLLTQEGTDKSIGTLLALDKNVMLKLVGIPLGPTRLKCALLPLEALQSGLRSYVGSRKTLAKTQQPLS